MTHKIKYIGLILSFLTAIQAINAQDSTFTLQQCRQQAIKYNKELKIANYQKQTAVLYKKAARTAYLPALNAEAELMYRPDPVDFNKPGGFLPTANSLENAQAGKWSGLTNTYSPGINFHLDNFTFFTAGISVTQPIYAGGKIYYSNKKATAGITISEYAYELKYSEIIETTDKAFWQLASIQANVKLAESYIEMLNELSEQINKMYELELIQINEKLKVNVQKNEADLQLLKAQNALKIAKMYLNQVIGRELNAEIKIKYKNDTLEIFNINEDITTAINNRNELKILNTQIKIAEYDKKTILAEYLPTAGINLKYSTIYIDDIHDNMKFKPMIGGKISIPIFAWGQGRQKQKAAQIKIQQQQEKLNNTNELINLEIMKVKIKIEEAYQTVKIAEKNIIEAKENLNEAQSTFNAGLNTTTELLKAQTDWQNANTQLINAKAKYNILKTSWLKVTGQLCNNN